MADAEAPDAAEAPADAATIEAPPARAETAEPGAAAGSGAKTPAPPHPLAYDDAPLPIVARPPAFIAKVVAACFVPVKLALLSIVAVLGWATAVALPRRSALPVLAALTRVSMCCFGVWPGCLSVDDRRKKNAAFAPVVVVAPHHGTAAPSGTFACSILLRTSKRRRTQSNAAKMSSNGARTAER